MVNFAQQLDSSMTIEWRDKYIQYAILTSLLDSLGSSNSTQTRLIAQRTYALLNLTHPIRFKPKDPAHAPSTCVEEDQVQAVNRQPQLPNLPHPNPTQHVLYQPTECSSDFPPLLPLNGDFAAIQIRNQPATSSNPSFGDPTPASTPALSMYSHNSTKSEPSTQPAPAIHSSSSFSAKPRQPQYKVNSTRKTGDQRAPGTKLDLQIPPDSSNPSNFHPKATPRAEKRPSRGSRGFKPLSQRVPSTFHPAQPFEDSTTEESDATDGRSDVADEYADSTTSEMTDDSSVSASTSSISSSDRGRVSTGDLSDKEPVLFDPTSNPNPFTLVSSQSSSSFISSAIQQPEINQHIPLNRKVTMMAAIFQSSEPNLPHHQNETSNQPVNITPSPQQLQHSTAHSDADSSAQLSTLDALSAHSTSSHQSGSSGYNQDTRGQTDLPKVGSILQSVQMQSHLNTPIQTQLTRQQYSRTGVADLNSLTQIQSFNRNLQAQKQFQNPPVPPKPSQKLNPMYTLTRNTSMLSSAGNQLEASQPNPQLAAIFHRTSSNLGFQLPFPASTSFANNQGKSFGNSNSSANHHPTTSSLLHPVQHPLHTATKYPSLPSYANHQTIDPHANTSINAFPLLPDPSQLPSSLSPSNAQLGNSTSHHQPQYKLKPRPGNSNNHQIQQDSLTKNQSASKPNKRPNFSTTLFSQTPPTSVDGSPSMNSIGSSIFDDDGGDDERIPASVQILELPGPSQPSSNSTSAQHRSDNINLSLMDTSLELNLNSSSASQVSPYSGYTFSEGRSAHNSSALNDDGDDNAGGDEDDERFIRFNPTVDESDKPKEHLSINPAARDGKKTNFQLTPQYVISSKYPSSYAANYAKPRRSRKHRRTSDGVGNSESSPDVDSVVVTDSSFDDEVVADDDDDDDHDDDSASLSSQTNAGDVSARIDSDLNEIGTIINQFDPDSTHLPRRTAFGKHSSSSNTISTHEGLEPKHPQQLLSSLLDDGDDVLLQMSTSSPAISAYFDKVNTTTPTPLPNQNRRLQISPTTQENPQPASPQVVLALFPNLPKLVSIDGENTVKYNQQLNLSLNNNSFDEINMMGGHGTEMNMLCEDDEINNFDAISNPAAVNTVKESEERRSTSMLPSLGGIPEVSTPTEHGRRTNFNQFDSSQTQQVLQTAVVPGLIIPPTSPTSPTSPPSDYSTPYPLTSPDNSNINIETTSNNKDVKININTEDQSAPSLPTQPQLQPQSQHQHQPHNPYQPQPISIQQQKQAISTFQSQNPAPYFLREAWDLRDRLNKEFHHHHEDIYADDARGRPQYNHHDSHPIQSATIVPKYSTRRIASVHIGPIHRDEDYTNDTSLYGKDLIQQQLQDERHQHNAQKHSSRNASRSSHTSNPFSHTEPPLFDINPEDDPYYVKLLEKMGTYKHTPPLLRDKEFYLTLSNQCNELRRIGKEALLPTITISLPWGILNELYPLQLRDPNEVLHEMASIPSFSSFIPQDTPFYEIENLFCSAIHAQFEKVNDFVLLLEEYYDAHLYNIATIIAQLLHSEQLLRQACVDDLAADFDFFIKQRDAQIDKIKKTMKEIYRGLHFLDDFAETNLIGFAKILKKHDKRSSFPSREAFLPLIFASHFAQSTAMEAMMYYCENLFSQVFGHKQTNFVLINQQDSSVTSDNWLRVGYFMGIVTVLVLINLFLFIFFPSRSLFSESFYIAFATYRVLGYLVFTGWVMGAVTHLCDKNRINYQLILQLNPQNYMKTTQIFEISSFLTLLLMSSFTFFMVFAAYDVQSELPRWSAVGTLVLFLALFFNPFDVMYRSTRYFIFSRTIRFFTAPFSPATIQEAAVVGNFWASLNRMLYDFTGVYCGITNDDRPEFNECTSYMADNGWWVRLVPPMMRLLQNVRSIYYTREWYPFTVNVIKYCFAIPDLVGAYMLRYTNYENTFIIALWILAALIRSIYGFFWDVTMDWQLPVRVQVVCDRYETLLKQIEEQRDEAAQNGIRYEIRIHQDAQLTRNENYDHRFKVHGCDAFLAKHNNLLNFKPLKEQKTWAQTLFPCLYTSKSYSTRDVTSLGYHQSYSRRKLAFWFIFYQHIMVPIKFTLSILYWPAYYLCATVGFLLSGILCFSLYHHMVYWVKWLHYFYCERRKKMKEYAKRYPQHPNSVKPSPSPLKPPQKQQRKSIMNDEDRHRSSSDDEELIQSNHMESDQTPSAANNPRRSNQRYVHDFEDESFCPIKPAPALIRTFWKKNVPQGYKFSVFPNFPVNFLPRELLRLHFNHSLSLYYFCSFMDLVLRCTFFFSVTPDAAKRLFGINNDWLIFVLGLLEVARRAMWLYLRLENEHLKSTHQLKAISLEGEIVGFEHNHRNKDEIIQDHHTHHESTRVGDQNHDNFSHDPSLSSRTSQHLSSAAIPPSDDLAALDSHIHTMSQDSEAFDANLAIQAVPTRHRTNSTAISVGSNYGPPAMSKQNSTHSSISSHSSNLQSQPSQTNAKSFTRSSVTSNLSPYPSIAEAQNLTKLVVSMSRANFGLHHNLSSLGSVDHAQFSEFQRDTSSFRPLARNSSLRVNHCLPTSVSHLPDPAPPSATNASISLMTPRRSFHANDFNPTPRPPTRQPSNGRGFYRFNANGSNGQLKNLTQDQ